MYIYSWCEYMFRIILHILYLCIVYMYIVIVVYSSDPLYICFLLLLVYMIFFRIESRSMIIKPHSARTHTAQFYGNSIFFFRCGMWHSWWFVCWYMTRMKDDMTTVLMLLLMLLMIYGGPPTTTLLCAYSITFICLWYYYVRHIE